MQPHLLHKDIFNVLLNGPHETGSILDSMHRAEKTSTAGNRTQTFKDLALPDRV